MLWEQAVRDSRIESRPRPGYLVFFDYTWDANRNGRRDDRLTHVAVVASVTPQGTVYMAHHGRRGIRTLRMNVRQPHRHRTRGGRLLNDFLRDRNYGGPRSPSLASQLVRGYARPPAPALSLAVR